MPCSRWAHSAISASNDLLFAWFLDLNFEDEPLHPTTFKKNRERPLEADAARVFPKELVRAAPQRRLFLPDRFTLEGVPPVVGGSRKGHRPREEDPSRCGGRERPKDFTGEHDAVRSTNRQLIPRRGSVTRVHSKRPSPAAWAPC